MSEDGRITDIDDGTHRRLAALARTVTPEDRQRLTPPADLWDAIAAAVDETASDDDPAAAGGATAASEDSIGTDRAHATPTPVDVGAGRVVPLRRRMPTIVLSAAAAVVLVLGIVALVTTGDEDERSGDLVATGALDALADGFEGDVELVEFEGRLELDVEVGALPEASDAYYELWLIKDLETGEMQSLGPIDGSGRIDLPRGLDPAQYATVDISVEPLDGVPTHSGQSVLRGTLDI